MPLTMSATIRALVAALLGALVLLACTPTNVRDTPPPPRTARELIQHFSVTGRMGITQGGRSNTVRIAWDHDKDTDLIGFAGPLGNKLAELQRTPTGALWTTSDGKRHEATTAEELIVRLTDTPLPVDSLARWMLGMAGPQAQVTRDASGRLERAVEGDWHIHISRYESDQPDALPALLEVEGNGLRVRMAIEDWQL